MKRIVIYILGVLAIMCASCSSMRQGVGLRGTVVDDELITLDGDTFVIMDHIGDSLLIVSKERFAEGVTDYLVKIGTDGLYYIQTKAEGIYTIDSTINFVRLNNGDVYDVNKRKALYRTAFDPLAGLAYLGSFDNIYLFANYDSLSFSDGKYLGLQPDVNVTTILDRNVVRLTFGAETIDLSPRELYLYAGKEKNCDKTVSHFKKDYFITPRNPYEREGNGFDVDIEIPIGNDSTDLTIRRWLLTQIRNELFSMLDVNPEGIAVSTCKDVNELTSCIDRYGVAWEKLLRYNYQEGDTLGTCFNTHIVIRRIVNNDDYATYYVSSCPYMGGAHDLPRSYYATYDKRRNVFLSAGNTIKEESRSKIALAALRSIKKQYDENNESESQWDDFVKEIFSYCFPSEGDDTVELLDSLHDDMYYCDKSTERTFKRTPATLSAFPLPHFAIIPEGIVFTYHPYQIDCFRSGEYHAVVAWKDVEGCLLNKYRQERNIPQLSMFFK